MKRLIVKWLEDADTALDRNANGLGCKMRLSHLSAWLDERWDTKVWRRPHGD